MHSFRSSPLQLHSSLTTFLFSPLFYLSHLFPVPSPSQHTLVKKRHEALLKAFGCFEQYKQSRLKVTKYSVGPGSIIPKAVVPPVAPRVRLSDVCDADVGSSSLLDQGDSSHRYDDDTGNDDSDGDNNGGNNGNSAIMRRKHPINSIPTPVSIPIPIPVRFVSELQPENVSDEALLQEVHYNYSKAFSELKLFHLAEKHLRLALALADEHERLRGNSYDGMLHNDGSDSSGTGDKDSGGIGADDGNSGSGNGNGSGRGDTRSSSGTPTGSSSSGGSGGSGNHFSHLQVTREAAHNLVLIYRKSGAIDQALHIMQKYLMF
jgi:hypothetical protein